MRRQIAHDSTSESGPDRSASQRIAGPFDLRVGVQISEEEQGATSVGVRVLRILSRCNGQSLGNLRRHMARWKFYAHLQEGAS